MVWLLLLVFGLALAEDGPVTLFDILRPGANQAIYDTLSQSVAGEYAGKDIAFDETSAIQFEPAPISIHRLNKKYRHVLYENDIVIRDQRILARAVNASILNGRKKRQAFLDRNYPTTIWGDGVPYSLHSSLNARGRASVIEAINFWQRETCINFRWRTNEVQYMDFIGNDDGCWSAVGKDDTQGRQVVSIGPGCEHESYKYNQRWPQTLTTLCCEHLNIKAKSIGVTSHELAHALGLFHEQSRYDRDRHVTLNTRVVSPLLLFNFAKVPPSELSTYNYPYDVGSVMHYQPTEFSLFRSVPALTSVDPNLQQTMGNMEGPSFVDIAILNRHYNCQSACRNQLSCYNGGITDSRNCNTCKCPSGFTGNRCQYVAPSFSSGCGGVLQAQEAVRRFDIKIRQTGYTRSKQCVYHITLSIRRIKAPTGKRILVNLVNIQGRCIEGCWQDSIELKMTQDFRPVGYRFCCQSTRRRILSSGNIVPFIVTSRSADTEMTFEYTYVDQNARWDDSQDVTATPTASSNETELETLEHRSQDDVTHLVRRKK